MFELLCLKNKAKNIHIGSYLFGLIVSNTAVQADLKIEKEVYTSEDRTIT